MSDLDVVEKCGDIYQPTDLLSMIGCTNSEIRRKIGHCNGGIQKKRRQEPAGADQKIAKISSNATKSAACIM